MILVRVALLALILVPAVSGQVIPGRYIVELTGEPAAAAVMAREARRTAIAGEQRTARMAVRAAGGRVLDAVDTVANALLVEMSAEGAAAMERSPGVLRVHPVRMVYARLNRVLPIHKVPEAWARIGGAEQAGKGIKIGILDSGIDQSHPGFQSNLTAPSGFPVVSPAQNQAFVNGKVIVARSYESIAPAGYGADAGDHAGHGTATGYAAAGSRIGTISGVAPGAFLGNYKVLGNNGAGSLDLVVKAIDDAVKDGMDVLNLSFGSDVAANPDIDIEVKAVEQAVAAGVIVVVAAGNAGPDENTIGSPGTAPSAITVGSSSSDRSLETNPPSALDPNRVSDFSSRGPNFGAGMKPDLLAVGDNFITADSTLKPDGIGLTATQGTSFSTPVVSGAAALLKGARPGLGALVYRSMLINSAQKLVYANGEPAPVRFAGAGRLNVEAALLSTFAVAPTALKFGIGNSIVNATQAFTVGNTGSSTATYSFSLDRYSGTGETIAMSATSLTLPAGGSGTVVVRFSGQGLAAGEYQGRLIVRASNSELEYSIPYWYAVSAGAVSQIAILATPEAGDPGTDKTFGIRTLDFSGVALASPVTVTPVCGGRVKQVVGNDPQFPGVTAAVVTLGTAAGNNVYRVDAGAVRRYVTIGVKGELDSSVSHVPACGITNGASFVGGEVAPGSFASIFGNRLASGLAQATRLPLGTELGGTSVSINGIPAPLFFVSPGQINFQVPYEVGVGAGSAVVRVGGTTLPAVPFTISAAAPGVLSFGENRAVAVNEDNTLNDVNNGARVRSTVVAYGTGLGAVDNRVATGGVAPVSGNPLSRPVGAVTVTIGGVAVRPDFLGLTPGFIGLMQVNLQIPTLRPGTYPLVVTVGGASSKPVRLTVR